MNTQTIVLGVHQGVVDTHIIVSGLQHSVTSTHTIISDIHRTIAKSQETADGKNLPVSIAYILLTAEPKLTAV